jgi:ferredoxin
MIKVTEDCPQDHPCPLIRMCPKQAITQEGFGLPKVDKDKCIECMICVKRCPYGAFIQL